MSPFRLVVICGLLAVLESGGGAVDSVRTAPIRLGIVGAPDENELVIPASVIPDLTMTATEDHSP